MPLWHPAPHHRPCHPPLEVAGGVVVFEGLWCSRDHGGQGRGRN